MKVIASQFIRSLMRGETPSGPQGPLPKGVDWKPAQFDWHGNEAQGHPDVRGWGDPEWTNKFKEAYKAASADTPNPPSFMQGTNYPESAARANRAYLEDWMQRPQVGALGERLGEPPSESKQRVFGDRSGWDSFRRSTLTEPSSRPESQPNANKLWWDDSDRQYPSPSEINSKYPDLVQEESSPLAKLGRINPVELARNLGSRVNAGPIGPWDFFPGGKEGYLDYITRGLGLGSFTGGDGSEGTPA